MPRSPRNPTTFFTTSSKPGTERSVCSAARSAGCSQVTGAIPVRILRGRSARAPVGSLMECSCVGIRALRRVRYRVSSRSRERLIEIGDQVLHVRSEEHTSELQSQSNLVCRLLLEKKKKKKQNYRLW